MRIRAVKTAVYEPTGKQSYRFTVNVPKKSLDLLGWKPGDEIDAAAVVGFDILILRKKQGKIGGTHGKKGSALRTSK